MIEGINPYRAAIAILIWTSLSAGTINLLLPLP
jgi:hypothetical protein